MESTFCTLALQFNSNVAILALMGIGGRGPFFWASDIDSSLTLERVCAESCDWLDAVLATVGLLSGSAAFESRRCGTLGELLRERLWTELNPQKTILQLQINRM